MKKIKIEDSATISRPFKFLLGFIVVCVVLVFFLFVASEAKHASIVFEPWDPTVTTNGHVDNAVLNTYRNGSDYSIYYTYMVNGKTYHDIDAVDGRNYGQQRILQVIYKKNDPSVSKLGLSEDNRMAFIGAAIAFTGILSGMALLSAYYFANWRPKNPTRIRRICANIIYVGVAIMLVSMLL